MIIADKNAVTIHRMLQDKFDVCAGAPIYTASTPYGRCALLKTLMTNKCCFDCAYCQNSVQGHQRFRYSPEELAKTFMSLFWKKKVKGLFLSSAIGPESDAITEEMLKAVRLIRFRHKFSGYIHFKILPGVSFELVKQASELADRLSINIECPTKSRLQEVSSTKMFFNDLVKRQFWIKRVNSNQTTQLVVGAADETDLEIIKMVDWEYNNLLLKRVYYSCFEPVRHTRLENRPRESLQRQNNLYRADFLMRQYRYRLEEIEGILQNEMLPEDDPKILIAKQTFSKPIDISNASYEEMIRVPGIGLKTAQKIVETKKKIVRRKQLWELGVVLSRAEPFIQLDGVQKTLVNYA